ncbi:hypothetical protein C483_15656 [Natrialba hulunbeirensis JCM 10989]|uniref:KEOPS complex Pcc1-like subunit n=1 Tax=Natrialba hulunbeirensis JCM 10989 TaxID=1227493 RepID=L9ZP84_9EURY|nr:KEOPS complex subunit Pcc1 [Natrialba hulunbeirensis]ELY88164.1 hypothetical protein C483_15656 [Natrialba hulunbeirensis JCM 10989]
MPAHTNTNTDDSLERATATIRTSHDDPDLVARALRPDNTDEMETVTDGDSVVTRIERESTSGLHSTVDDYVVNLEVAVDVARTAREAGVATDATAQSPAPPASATSAASAASSTSDADADADAADEQRDNPTDTGTVSDTDTDNTHDTNE